VIKAGLYLYIQIKWWSDQRSQVLRVGVTSGGSDQEGMLPQDPQISRPTHTSSLRGEVGYLNATLQCDEGGRKSIAERSDDGVVTWAKSRQVWEICVEDALPVGHVVDCHGRTFAIRIDPIFVFIHRHFAVDTEKRD
jgi:hypothetical protein